MEVGITGILKEKCKLNDKFLMLMVRFEGGWEIGRNFTGRETSGRRGADAEGDGGSSRRRR